MERATLDRERQQKAKEYARIRRRLILVDLIFGVAYITVWLVFGWSSALKNALLELTANDWALVALYAVVFGGVYFAINLPLAFYEGYVLPHKYEMSTQTLKGWLWDLSKSLVLSAFFGLLILQLIYATLRAAPETWWLWAAGVLLLFNVVLANLGPVLLMPIFYKIRPLEEEHAGLAERLTHLAKGAGAQVRGVYKFDMSRRTKAANAALAGLGNTRRIVLGDTLLKEFTTDEIETVVAHELAHHAHKDIPAGILVSTALTLGGLYAASLALRSGAAALGFEGPADIAALPVLLLAMGMYAMITMPLGNAYSRWRERRADEYALQVTRKGEAYASALTRLANQNLAEVDPEPWVEWLLYSHPSLKKRIEMAEAPVE